LASSWNLEKTIEVTANWYSDI